MFFRRKLKIPGRRGTGRRVVTVTFRGAKGRVASKLRFRLEPGRRVLRARVSGLRAGTYRYVTAWATAAAYCSEARSASSLSRPCPAPARGLSAC